MSLVDYDVCSGESSSDEDSGSVPRVQNSLEKRGRPLHLMQTNSAATTPLTSSYSPSTLQQSMVSGNVTNEIAPSNARSDDLEPASTAPPPKKNDSVTPFMNVSGKKGPVKITAPEMAPVSSDSDEEIEGVPRKRKPVIIASKDKPRSGLFAKLPPPSNFGVTNKGSGRTFLPYVFSKPIKETSTRKSDAHGATDDPATTTGSSSGSLSIAEIRKNSASARAKVISRQVAANGSDAKDDSDDDNEISGGGFFSFPEKLTRPDNEDKLSLVSFVSGDRSTPSQNVIEAAPVTELAYYEAESKPYMVAPPASQPEMPAGNDAEMEAILHLQGKRRKKEEVNFIDIRADDALEGNKELLLKSISEEKNMNRTSHSKKKSGMPSGIQKRKHQLSYLVFQAKQRELELKNTWAQNRATRQQTQAKYGF